jgi:hypothetical protein
MEGEKKYNSTLSLTIVLDGEGCQGRAPAALPLGKRPDLYSQLRHEYIITVRGIVLTLTDLTLWRKILQQMKVCLLEEQLWLVVCMEFDIRAYQYRRLSALAKWRR